MPEDMPEDGPRETPPARAARQDPHRAAPDRERQLEVAIGREVRALRLARRLTVKDVAGQTGLSLGMLSKIENGQTSPSLTTLQTLADALNTPLTAFFRRYEENREVVHTPSGAGVEIVREGTRAGHQYRLLGHLSTTSHGVTVEPYLITLTDASDTFPTFQHDGVEMIYVLEGEVGYRHGKGLHHLRPGDTLFFDADAPHGPEVLIALPVRFLSIISYREGG